MSLTGSWTTKTSTGSLIRRSRRSLRSPRDDQWPSENARGTPVKVIHSDPASWKLVSDADSRQVLRLRLTAVPGWHASIDGRPVPLQRFAGVMLQVEVPAGRHTVELYYWPATFTAGLVFAGCAIVGLLAAAAIGWDRRRRHPGAPEPHRTAD